MSTAPTSSIMHLISQGAAHVKALIIVVITFLLGAWHAHNAEQKRLAQKKIANLTDDEFDRRFPPI